MEQNCRNQYHQAMFRFLVLCLLVPATGCQLNRSFAPISPSQMLGSERGRQGIAAMEHGDLPKAEKFLESAVKLNKNDINHRLHYAEVLWQQGKFQESLQQLDEAVKRDGQNNASPHIALAKKYLTMQEYEMAFRHADAAVRLNSRDFQSWALRGRVQRLQASRRGDADDTAEMFHRAREDYLRAASLASQDRELLTELAAVQMNCGQPKQALATWLTVQSLYPQDGEPDEVLIGKTETLAMLHRFDEAETCLLALRQRGTENTAAERRLRNIMAAAQKGTRW